MRLTVAALTVLTSLIAVTSAKADATYIFRNDGCTGTCGSADPFATVTITNYGVGTNAYVLVTETLAPSERYAGTGAGDALEFNVAGAITVANVSANFGLYNNGASDSASTFGTFLHAVTCLTCQGGKASNPAGPLSFEVHSAIGVTSASFLTNVGGYFFASDIVGNNGNTGNVASDVISVAHTLTATPEPGTVVLLLSGLVLIGGGSLRKRVRS